MGMFSCSRGELTVPRTVNIFLLSGFLKEQLRQSPTKVFIFTTDYHPFLWLTFEDAHTKLVRAGFIRQVFTLPCPYEL